MIWGVRRCLCEHLFSNTLIRKMIPVPCLTNMPQYLLMNSGMKPSNSNTFLYICVSIHPLHSDTVTHTHTRCVGESEAKSCMFPNHCKHPAPKFNMKLIPKAGGLTWSIWMIYPKIGMIISTRFKTPADRYIDQMIQNESRYSA